MLHKPNDGVVENRSSLFSGDRSVHRVNRGGFAWYSHAKLLTGPKVFREIAAELKDVLEGE